MLHACILLPMSAPPCLLQGAAMGGVVDYQNQTMKQAFKEMLKNTASKSRCGWVAEGWSA